MLGNVRLRSELLAEEMAEARTAQICDLKKRRPAECDWPQSLSQRVLRPVLAKELVGLVNKTEANP